MCCCGRWEVLDRMGQEKKMVELMDCELAPLELNQEKVCCAEEPPYHLLKRESLGLIS